MAEFAAGVESLVAGQALIATATASHGSTSELSPEFVIPASVHSIVLQGSGQNIVLSEPGLQLDGIELIDIRGSGDNTLELSAERIRESTGAEIMVISDSGDKVVFDDGWQFAGAIISNGRLIRQFANAGAQLNLAGPDDFTNPIDIHDVSGNGDVTALDALQVINEMGARRFSDFDTNSGQLREISEIDADQFRFYDVNADHRVSALDALWVINEMARRIGSVLVGESIPIPQLLRNDLDQISEVLRIESSPESLGPDVKVMATPAQQPMATRSITADTPQESSDAEEPDELQRELIDAAIGDLFLD